MKTILLLIPSIFFFTILVSSCCNCGGEDENILKGRIVVVGNEPFARVALSIDNEKAYVLECSEELQRELLKNQGYFYAVKYSEIKIVNELPIIVVEEVTPLNEKDNNQDEK